MKWFWLTAVGVGAAIGAAPERREIWHDPLTVTALAAVAAARENRGGEFEAAT